MNTKKYALYFAVGLAGSSSVMGYELVTHGQLTQKAYEKSILFNPQNLQPSQAFANRLGITPWIFAPLSAQRQVPFGTTYYDLGVAGPGAREATSFEGQRMPRAVDEGISPAQYLINGWIMRGAIREDDVVSSDRSGNPQDDPGGNIYRVFNHFYDPVNDMPLNGIALLNNGITSANNGLPAQRSPAWGIGTANPFPPAGTPIAKAANYRNQFSLFNAREAMWRALTLTKKNDDGSFGDLLIAPSKQEIERKRYWATTFRSLGDALHLIQDMSQPQHTRNEPHSGLGPSILETITGHASWLEVYVEARASNEKSFEVDYADQNLIVKIKSPAPLTGLDTYPAVKLNRYSDYWTTQPKGAVAVGLGIADYSNRGFVTAGSILAQAKYDLPPKDLAAYTPTVIAPRGWDGTALAPQNPNLKMTVYSNAVSDTAGGSSAPSVPQFTKSMWDIALKNRGFREVYSQNNTVYDEQIKLLLPRAVGYSAGVINYFFRGEMKVFPPDEGVFAILDHANAADNCKDDCGFKKVKLKLANSTPDIDVSGGGGKKPQQMTTGALVAVAKFHRNTCYDSTLSDEFDTSESSETDIQHYNRCRSTNEEIVISDPVTVASVPLCDATITVAPNRCIDKAQLQKFTFPAAIPINATDLSLQVVYRGLLGEEQDAVVVETVDVAEPTYVAVVNTSDYLFCYNGQWRYKEADGSLPTGVPDKLQFRPFTYNAWRTAFEPNENDPANKYVATVANLAPKEFARIAVLTLKDRVRSSQISYGVTSTASEGGNLRGNEFQLDFISETQVQLRLLDYKEAVRKVRAAVTVFANEPYSDAGQPQTCPAQLPPHPGYPPHTKPTAIKPVTIVFPF
jgi:hypothetical protein